MIARGHPAGQKQNLLHFFFFLFLMDILIVNKDFFLNRTFMFLSLPVTADNTPKASFAKSSGQDC